MAKKSNLKKSTAPARKPSAPPAKKGKKPARPVVKSPPAKPVKAKTTLKPASRPAVAAAPPPKQAPKPLKRIKSPLNKAELEEFRHILLDKRRAILGDMSSIEADALRTNRQDGSGDLSNMPTHPADIGSDNFEQEFTLGLLDSERKLLSEINQALERIDGGTFGVCVGTGEVIGLPRLRARPWAKYCIEYAKLLEKGLVVPESEQPPNATDDEEDEDDASPTENDTDDADESDDDDGFVQEDTED